MNWRDSLQSRICPEAYARRQVSSMLQELHDRPRIADAVVYRQLDELNLETQALELKNLSAAYRQGQKSNTLGAEKNSVRDAMGRRQTGFALQLARTVFADGDVNPQEKLAIGEINNQHYTIYGHCGELPRLHYTEALDLQAFANAPSNEVRAWMLEQGTSPKVDMPAARQLAELFYADGNLSEQEKRFVESTQDVFGTPIQSEARMFLRGLGSTQLLSGDATTASLLDEARSRDFAGLNPVSQCYDAKAGSHVEALQEAIAFTQAHKALGTKG